MGVLGSGELAQATKGGIELEQLRGLTWQEAIAGAARELAAAGVDAPENDARLLADHVGIGAHQLRDAATGEPFAQFQHLVARRRDRLPLQHVTGRMWFRYLELAARPGTFIVRPETELVAQAAIDELNRLAVNRRAQGSAHRDVPLSVDLCTGSGAIAISIATEVSDVHAVGIELSTSAFATASENNARYGNLVELRQGNIFTCAADLYGQCDVVVSNPPYVPLTHSLSAEVLYDPPLALFGGGDDGLEFPLRVVQLATSLLKPGGLLVLEHASEQSGQLRESAAQSGFMEVCTRRDYTGAERWLEARLGK